MLKNIMIVVGVLSMLIGIYLWCVSSDKEKWDGSQETAIAFFLSGVVILIIKGFIAENKEYE